MGILKEANEPPLRIRRKERSMVTATKIASNPKKPTFQHTFSNRNKIVFNSHPTLPKPFYNRILTYQQEIGITLAEVIPRRISILPLWNNPPIKFNTDLHLLNKIETPDQVYKTLFKELIGKYHNYIHIYTGGSKTPKGTACAIVCNSETRMIRLPID